MKKFAVLIVFAFSSPSFAQSHNDDLKAVTNQQWTKLGAAGTIRFAFGTNVTYGASGAQVAVRTITPLASGEEKLHIDLGVFPCQKGTGIPRTFIHENSVDMIVQPDGFAQVDPSAISESISPSYGVDIEKGSVLELVASKVCGTL